MTEDRIEMPSGLTAIVLPEGEWLVDPFEMNEFLAKLNEQATAEGRDYYWQLDRVRDHAAQAGFTIGKDQANRLFFEIPQLIAKKNRTLLSAFTGTLAYPASTGSGPAPSPKPSESASKPTSPD